MDWAWTFIGFIVALIALMLTGLPVAFCFLLINIVGVVIFWGSPGLLQIIHSMVTSLVTFTLVPVPMFILMGEVIWHSGIAMRAIDCIEKWLGRTPGRLGLLAVGGGTLFACLSGSSMASAAMMGSLLYPEMEKRGYKKPMSLGPILGSGGLAVMIPPSALAVLLAVLAETSVSRVLMGGIFPGLIMAVLYASYIIIRCRLQPHLAPAYDIAPSSLTDKIIPAVRYVLPLGSIIFLVIGLIFLGVASPTESSAVGCLGTFILAAAYHRLDWELVKKSALGTLRVVIMVLLIVATATTFSQILVFSGASQGMLHFVANLPLGPIAILIVMQLVLLVLGMFLSLVAIMMITLPVFLPVCNALGIDITWFAVLFLLNMEMAQTTPPFGILLYVMKGVAPPDVTMGDCIKAGLPFLGCDTVTMALMLAFPALALWLPNAMISV